MRNMLNIYEIQAKISDQNFITTTVISGFNPYS